jgi:hypothetical protein
MIKVLSSGGGGAESCALAVEDALTSKSIVIRVIVSSDRMVHLVNRVTGDRSGSGLYSRREARGILQRILLKPQRIRRRDGLGRRLGSALPPLVHDHTERKERAHQNE